MNMPSIEGDTAPSAADEIRALGVGQGQTPRPVTGDVPLVDKDGNTASSASDTRQHGGVPDSLVDAGPRK